MRTSQSARHRVEAPESPPVEIVSTTTIDDDAPSVWERVAVVVTIFVGFQFALLAVLGL